MAMYSRPATTWVPGGQEDDGEPFKKKSKRLTATLRELRAEEVRS